MEVEIMFRNENAHSFGNENGNTFQNENEIQIGNENENENRVGNELGSETGNELEMNSNIIKLSDCGFIPRTKHIINTDYGPEVVVSAILECKVNGKKVSFPVKADNIQDAIRETIPTICYQVLVFTNNYTFKELGLPNPKYKTPTGETREITNVYQFGKLTKTELNILNQQRHIDLLHIKARNLYEVEV